MSAIPQGIGREEWLHALPRALVAGFVKTDIDFQRRGMYWVMLSINVCFIIFSWGALFLPKPLIVLVLWLSMYKQEKLLVQQSHLLWLMD